ncbi:MAG: beta-xylosidase, partial [Clostridia bacterium]|nr:beta-xylosidase [Clostridia bacterium]
MECKNGKYYVFYHRQTNGHCYSRQACAEEIKLLPNGTFKQAEITSCGLNGGPLIAEGKYEARIACNLFSKKGVYFYGAVKPFKSCHPYFTQTGKDREQNGDQYIANFCNGATAGFKYFAFNNNQKITVTVGGKARGIIELKDCLNGNIIGVIEVNCKKIGKNLLLN